MKIEQQASIYLKKQALQLIISLYLTRKKYQDIQFLKKNFRTTQELAAGIRSSLQYGLSSCDIETNRITFGENQKKLPQKCLSFLDCIKQQFFFSLFYLASFLLLTSSLLYGKINLQKQIFQTAHNLVRAQIIITLCRVMIQFVWSYTVQKHSLNKTKNNLYQVLRNGSLIQIEQSQIVVGDIIRLGFKQSVPATGILVSSQQIFIKQKQNQQSASLKINLQSCLRKIQNMSMLDLKMSFQNCNLPSPIVLRGSELLKGNQYSMLVISVTEQSLLKEFDIDKADEFTSKRYDQWMQKALRRWKKTSIYLVCFFSIILILNKIVDMNLYSLSTDKSLDLLFKSLLKIAVMIIILDSKHLVSYLCTLFLKLLNELKIVSKFEDLFTLRRILFNQQKIVYSDEIIVQQLALCDKSDLITILQIKDLSESTKKIIQQIQELFELKIDPENKNKTQKTIYNKIIHANKRTIKIISIYSQSRIQFNNFRQVFNQIANISQNNQSNQHKTTISNKKQTTQQKQSTNLLKVTQQNFITQQAYNNLKQIIHSRFRIKSRSILDGLVGIAQNGLRTYHFQIFDMQKIQQINFIIQKGRTILFTENHKQKMVMLAHKMSLIYNLTPFMVAFNQGSYNEKPARTLVCILGVSLIKNCEIFQKLNQLETRGVKSLIFMNPNHNTISKQIQQKNIISQYFDIIGPDKQYSSKICSADQIKNILNRLVCTKCQISNCGCTQKIEEAANIQPFISLSRRLKIVYDTGDQSLRYMQNAYRQIQNSVICIDSTNLPAIDVLDTIFSCLNFIQSLKRSVVLFYAVSSIYFGVAIIYWLSNIQILSPMQIGLSYLITIFVLSFAMLCQVKSTTSNISKEDRLVVRVISKQLAIIVYCIILFILLFSWLFYKLHYLLPQYKDKYDTILQFNNLDIFVCKYGNHNSMTISFKTQYCRTPELNLQFSRISTLIITYIFTVTWMLIVAVHRNFKSIWSVLSYVLMISFYTGIIQYFPNVIYSYAYGLTWQHYVIVCTASLITLLIGYIVGYLITKIPIVQQIAQQIESTINFDNNNKNNYIDKLKQYTQQKLQKQNTSIQLFN